MCMNGPLHALLQEDDCRVQLELSKWWKGGKAQLGAEKRKDVPRVD